MRCKVGFFVVVFLFSIIIFWNTYKVKVKHIWKKCWDLTNRNKWQEPKKIVRPVSLSCPIRLLLLAAQRFGTATSPQAAKDALLGKKRERNIPWLRAMSTRTMTQKGGSSSICSLFGNIFIGGKVRKVSSSKKKKKKTSLHFSSYHFFLVINPSPCPKQWQLWTSLATKHSQFINHELIQWMFLISIYKFYSKSCVPEQGVIRWWNPPFSVLFWSRLSNNSMFSACWKKSRILI